jgi:plasmid stability protein
MTKIPQPTPFPLRMPDELRARVEVLAKTNGRSTNAEIVAVLDATTGGAPLHAVPVEDLLKAVAERLGATVQVHVMTAPVAPAKTGTRQSK